MIHVKKSLPHPAQVDDFPKNSERSHAGALYLTPGSTKEVTPDEWAHLQKCHLAPHLALIQQ